MRNLDPTAEDPFADVDPDDIVVMDDMSNPWTSPPVRMVALMLHILLREHGKNDIVITEADQKQFDEFYPNRPTVAIKACNGHIHGAMVDLAEIEQMAKDTRKADGIKTTEH